MPQGVSAFFKDKQPSVFVVAYRCVGDDVLLRVVGRLRGAAVAALRWQGRRGRLVGRLCRCGVCHARAAACLAMHVQRLRALLSLPLPAWE